jgi:hypothetical protein
MYQQMIREELARIGRLGVDPRHVEGFLRIEHSTLDGLDVATFRREVKVACECIDAAGRDISERLARSYAL